MARISRALGIAAAAGSLVVGSAAPAHAVNYDYVGEGCAVRNVRYVEPDLWGTHMYRYEGFVSIVITSDETVAAPVYFAYMCSFRYNGVDEGGSAGSGFAAYAGPYSLAFPAMTHAIHVQPTDVVEVCTSVRFDTGALQAYSSGFHTKRCEAVPLPPAS